MLGLPTLEDALASEPREMVSVSPELWRLLRSLYRGGALRQEFQAAWTNGQAFLRAEDGLRHRTPRVVEWKGAIRAPGDEVVPADLRVDHVYFVSCKYLSKIVLNASPAHVFDRLLAGGHGTRGEDWYRVVAPRELAALYRQAVAQRELDLPANLDGLTPSQRRACSAALRGRWPTELRQAAAAFAEVVATRSAARWAEALRVAGASERMLWRLLRIGSAPYFVLGADSEKSLRLRIQTPWDWKQRYRLERFEVSPMPGEQPIVKWIATVEDLHAATHVDVVGHVEIRWSHGKFNGPPEAKVYLDTPHHRVPGYVELT